MASHTFVFAIIFVFVYARYVSKFGSYIELYINIRVITLHNSVAEETPLLHRKNVYC